MFLSPSACDIDIYLYVCVCFTLNETIALIMSVMLLYSISCHFHNTTFIKESFVTRLIQMVPPEEQGLLTIPKHPSSTPVFSVVRVIRSYI